MPPRVRHALMACASTLGLCLAQAALADTSDRADTAMQLGSTLADVDFVRGRCNTITVDQAKFDELAQRAQQTPERLRQGKAYAELQAPPLIRSTEGGEAAGGPAR